MKGKEGCIVFVKWNRDGGIIIWGVDERRGGVVVWIGWSLQWN